MTVNQSLLLEVLSHLGVWDTTGSWFSSYFLHQSAPKAFSAFSFLIYIPSLSVIQPHGFQCHLSPTRHELGRPAWPFPQSLVSISIWFSNRYVRLNMFEIKLLVPLPRETCPSHSFPPRCQMETASFQLLRGKTWESS